MHFCFQQKKKKECAFFAVYGWLLYFFLALSLLILGTFLEVLHNSYVKGGLALGALLGPGRG